MVDFYGEASWTQFALVNKYLAIAVRGCTFGGEGVVWWLACRVIVGSTPPSLEYDLTFQASRGPLLDQTTLSRLALELALAC